MRRLFLGLAAIIITALLMGCTSAGPKLIGPAQFNYNQTVASSWNEQLLLNLVRVHYRDTPVFLEIDQILAGYTFEKELQLGIDVIPGTGQSIDRSDAGVSGTLVERPTVTLSPLQGNEFTSRLHTPIAPETLLLLAESGWQIERVLMCCVHQVNGLRNLPASPDANVGAPSSYREFQNLAADLEAMQRSGGSLNVAVNAAGRSTVALDGSGASSVRSRLGLPNNSQPVPLTPSGSRRQAGELRMVGRSFFGVLNYLSSSVESPPSHVQAGLVNSGGTSEPLFQIHSSRTKPAQSFVAVRYRDHWFSISDRDLDTKETFGLLTQLFSLQASGGDSRSPLLSIPAG